MVNFTKSDNIPSSLITEKEKGLKGSYGQEDVLKQLREDFHNKCYLCEIKEPTSINIEHFIPHQKNVNIMFDWKNLYYVCVHCNNIKLAVYNTKPENMILNCLNPEHLVCDGIYYKVVQGFPNEKFSFEPRYSYIENKKIVLKTTEILDKIYNGHTVLKKIEGENMRGKVMEELLKFVNAINSYYHKPEDRYIYLSKIKRHLSRSSAFTAFKRWYILDKENLRQDFQRHFD